MLKCISQAGHSPMPEPDDLSAQGDGSAVPEEVFRRRLVISHSCAFSWDMGVRLLRHMQLWELQRWFHLQVAFPAPFDALFTLWVKSWFCWASMLRPCLEWGVPWGLLYAVYASRTVGVGLFIASYFVFVEKESYFLLGICMDWDPFQILFLNCYAVLPELYGEL